MATAILETEVIPPSELTENSESEDLIHCSICHNLFEDPRTLSCLHTFCLKCLVMLVVKEANEKMISCPTCSVLCKLPDSDVAGLGTIAFIVRQTTEAKMREELADRDRNVECTACEEGSSATMRCFECEDYLCETCVKSHKRNRHWKKHKLLTTDELVANKELQTIPDQNICSKHKGETLMFYCDTCDIPICSKCVVVTHRHPGHKQAEIDEDSTDQRKKRIKELENESGKVATKTDESISLTAELERKLNTSSAAAMSELDDIKESLKSKFLEKLETRYNESKDAIQKSENQKTVTIKKKVTELTEFRSRLTASKKIAQDIVVKGSEFEIASGYSNVTRSLTELCKMEMKLLPDYFGEMRVSFGTGKKLVRENTVGNLCTVFTGKICEMKQCKKFGELNSLKGISFTEDEGVVVSNIAYSECYLQAYNYKGDLLFKFKQTPVVLQHDRYNRRPTTSYRYYQPWCVIYSSDKYGQYFITDSTHYVKLFSGEPVDFKKQFNVLSPNGVQSGEGSNVQGLALDKDGNLIAGNVTKKYVSIMKTDGKHITSMDVAIRPYFISATPTDTIIISSYNDHAVQVIDRTGKVLLTLNPPDGMLSDSWYPTGVCCSKEGAIFIANYKKQVGIFQYCLSDGKYIGCCTKDVAEPWGIALSEDEVKLAVADGKHVKIFVLQ